MSVRTPIDGQNLIVPDGAACDGCGCAVRGRLICHGHRMVCVDCWAEARPRPSEAPREAPSLEEEPPAARGDGPPAIACWMPDGPVVKPARTTLVDWETCLEQLAAYPEWWGRGRDVTAEQERDMVRQRVRGHPHDDKDRQRVESVTFWRQCIDAAGVMGGDPPLGWDHWCEFHVPDVEGATLKVLCLGPCSSGRQRQLLLRHPGISATGRLTVWAAGGDEAAEGEGVREYAERVARRDIRAEQRRAARRGRQATGEGSRL